MSDKKISFQLIFTSLNSQTNSEASCAVNQHPQCVLWMILVTDGESQCSVCMEDFHLEDVVRSLPCQHLFHTDCINPWLHLVDML